jgi:hypothetical protein
MFLSEIPIASAFCAWEWRIPTYPPHPGKRAWSGYEHRTPNQTRNFRPRQLRVWTPAGCEPMPELTRQFALAAGPLHYWPQELMGSTRRNEWLSPRCQDICYKLAQLPGYGCIKLISYAQQPSPPPRRGSRLRDNRAAGRPQWHARVTMRLCG